MDRVLFGFLAIFAVTSAFARTAAAPEVIFVSPCECEGFHGKNRWITKTDQSPVPLDKSAIQSVTPSQIYAWEGLEPNVVLTGTTEERMPAEQKWYALTGRPHRPILIARDGGGVGSQHVYEVRPRKDKRGVDLISDALPFGRRLACPEAGTTHICPRILP